jgi:hypothetical protein
VRSEYGKASARRRARRVCESPVLKDPRHHDLPAAWLHTVGESRTSSGAADFAIGVVLLLIVFGCALVIAGVL